MPLFTRQRVVDAAGGGTDPTIASAFAAALAGGANYASSIYYHILVAPGVYTENVSFPTTGGIVLQGCGRLTKIAGTVDLYPGCEIRDFLISQATAKYTVGLRLTGTADPIYAYNLLVDNAQNANDTVAAVECSGTALGVARMLNCWIYARNQMMSSAPLAKTVGIRLMADFANEIEFFGGHIKTSSGGGFAEPVCVLNHQIGGGAVPFGYAHVVTDWMAGYAGLGDTPPPVLLDSANQTHPGGTLDVACWNPAGVEPIIRSAYTGTPTSANVGPPAHVRYQHRVFVGGGPSDGETYELSPRLILDHVPTGADEAPDGTVAYVVS